MPSPRRNVELKARDAEPERSLERARALGAEDRGELRQRDTYFATPRGRLKLREQEPGGARFLEGDPIIMDADDVIETASAAPRATIVAVHMEALNHCPLRRAELRAAVDDAGVGGRVVIPEDGETLRF